MGTHLRVLSESYQINTNMTGYRWFPKIFASLCFFFTKVASALEGLIATFNCITRIWCISVCGSSVVLLDLFLYETGVHNNNLNDNGTCM